MNQAIMTGCVSAEWMGPTIVPVEGYENYFVDTNGNIYSRKPSGFKMRAPSTNAGGYQQIYLFKAGQHKSPLIHRLVWETFVGPVPAGLEIDHINQDKSDNSLQNLRLATRAQNKCNNKAKNYFLCRRTNRWVVSFFKQSKLVFKKSFVTEAEAKCAAEIMRPAIHGAFARTISV